MAGRRVYVEERGKSIRLRWRYQGAWQSHTLYGRDGKRFVKDARAAIEAEGCNVVSGDPRLTDGGSLYRPDADLAATPDVAATFDALARDVIAGRPKASTYTRERALRELDGALSHWSSRPVRSIDPDEVNAWLADLIDSKRYAAGTVRRYGQLIRTTLKLAYARRLRKDDAGALVILPEPDNSKHSKRYLSGADVARVIAVTDRPMYADMWHVLAFTGLRIGEVLALRAGSVYLDTGRILVEVTVSADRKSETRGKSRNAERYVPLLPDTVDVLRRYVVGKRPDEYVFTRPDGRRLPHQTVNAVWHTARKAANLPGARIHDLRHAYATFLLNDAGMPLAAASKLLGHGSIAITADVYHHLNRQTDELALAALAKHAPASLPTPIASGRKAAS